MAWPYDSQTMANNLSTWKPGANSKSGNNNSGVGQFGINAPKVDYTGMTNQLKSGTMANGQQIPQWTPPSSFNFTNPNWTPYNFTTQNISGVPQQAFKGAANNILDNMSIAQQRLGNQAINASNARGFGNGGIASGMQAGIARDLGQDASQQMRDLGLQQAQSQVDVNKFQAGLDQARQQAQAQQGEFGAGLDQWRQQQQAGNDLSRSQLGLQGTQALNNMNLQQIGAQGTLQKQAYEQAMQPYQMLASLYGVNTGISPGAGGGKGDPFSALLGAGAGMAEKAFL